MAQAKATGARPLHLPTDRPRAGRLTGVGAVERVELDPARSAAVTELATARGTTPFAALLAAFAALAHELTGSPMIAPHCGSANRVETRFEHVMGDFAHSSWLLVDVADATSFGELVDRGDRGGVATTGAAVGSRGHPERGDRGPVRQQPGARTVRPVQRRARRSWPCPAWPST